MKHTLTLLTALLLAPQVVLFSMTGVRSEAAELATAPPACSVGPPIPQADAVGRFSG